MEAVVGEVLRRLRPTLGEMQREGLKRAAAVFPRPIFSTGVVVTNDVPKGTVEVQLDGDPPGTHAHAQAVGPIPPVRSRCMTVFVDGGGLYCLGSMGSLRLVLPMTGDVTETSTHHPLQIGESGGLNLALDNNEIQARDGNDDPGTLALNHSGGSVELGGVGMVGVAPSGVASIAYYGNAAIWNGSTYGVACPSDGRLLLNTSTGQYIEFRENNSQTGMLRVRATSGNTAMTFPMDLPTISGLTAVGVHPTTKQLGYITSSIRFKTSVAEIGADTAAAIVAGLRPVTYRYRPNDAAEPGTDQSALRAGFIAEQVAGVLPEAVAFDGEGLPHSLDMNAVCAVLVGAVNALTARVAALEALLDVGGE